MAKNRIDQVVVFHNLTMDELVQIVELELDKISERLEEQKLVLDATPEARAFLAKEGYSEEFGARNLRRTVQQAIEDELSERILSGRFSPGDHVRIEVQDGEITLTSTRGMPESPLLEAVVAGSNV